jgi:hypothetical protein
MRLARLSGRAASGVLVAALAVAATPSDAQEASDPAYFCYRFGGTISRVLVGPDGRIYVAGTTKTPDLPASTSTPEPWNPPYDHYWNTPQFAFAAVLAPDGSPLWTSYVRERHFDNVRLPIYGPALGPDGSVWIAASSPIEEVNPFPSAIGDEEYLNDGWVAKFDAAGTLQFASHLRTKWTGLFNGLAVDAEGDAIVVGSKASSDFPGAEIHDEWHFSEDAFVASIRSDGSGLKWATRLPGTGINAPYRLDGSGVAIDPADATILATFVGTADDSGPLPARGLRRPRGARRPPPYSRSVSTFVARLTPGGAILATAKLGLIGAIPVNSGGWIDPVAAVTPLSDGSVLVGGTWSIARLSHGLSAVESVWNYARESGWWWESQRETARVCVSPDGRTLVVDTLDSRYYHSSPRLRTLDDVSREVIPINAGLGFDPTDIAFDSRGDLCAVGDGTAIEFSSPVTSTATTGSFVAKVPLAGGLPAGDLTATVRGPNVIDLAWTQGGVVPLRYELERVGPFEIDPWLSIDRWSARIREAAIIPGSLDVVPGSSREHRVTGLAPGSDHAFRVVAVYPSGVRLASYASATTSPLPPLAVTATRGPGHRVTVAWDEGGDGDATRYLVQWRFTDGRHVGDSISAEWTWEFQRDSPIELDRRTMDAAVTFRVRAVAGGIASDWVEAPPLPRRSE